MILKFLILKYTDTVSIMFSTQKHEIEEGIFTVLRSIITIAVYPLFLWE